MHQQIEYVQIDSLIPYARNSRTHSDAQVAQIAASIKEFGFTNPVLIDKDGGIIAGHGRVMAARKLKLADVPCIRLGHLTDTQKRAYVIADNKLALNAGWDAEALRVELGDLDASGFDLELTGFVGDDLTKAMFGDLLEEAEKEVALDAEKYTTKIEVPIYEIKGKKPELSDIYDQSKSKDLIQDINGSKEIPENIKSFLIAAAQRHTIFNYENIAEFYAHANPEVQRLMERSALVIIDYDKAIEEGYVKLSKELMSLSQESDNASE